MRKELYQSESDKNLSGKNFGMEFQLSDSQELFNYLSEQDHKGSEGVHASIIGDSGDSDRYILDDCVAHDLASKITRKSGRNYELKHVEDWTHILKFVDKAVVKDDVRIFLPEDFGDQVRFSHERSNHSGVDAPTEAYDRTIDFLDQYTEKLDLDRYIPGLEIAEADIGERDRRIAMAALGDATLITYDQDFAELPVNTETPLHALYDMLE